MSATPDTRPLFLIPATPPDSEEDRTRLLKSINIGAHIEPNEVVGTVTSDSGATFVRIRKENSNKRGTFTNFDFPLVSDNSSMQPQQQELVERPQQS